MLGFAETIPEMNAENYLPMPMVIKIYTLPYNLGNFMQGYQKLTIYLCRSSQSLITGLAG